MLWHILSALTTMVTSVVSFSSLSALLPLLFPSFHLAWALKHMKNVH